MLAKVLAGSGGLALGSAFVTNLAAQTQSKERRPNILFIFADDLHFRGIGCAGNPEVRTPNIDRLAMEGTRFTHCHVSNPICTPSRAAVQTGQYGFRNGVTFFSQVIRDDSPRIARLLGDRGYATGYTGKWHNDGRPIDHGFQFMRHTFLGGMHTYDSIPVVEGESDEPHELKRNPTDLFTEGALELLGEMPKPFGLFLCYTAPHDPRTPPPAYEAMYPPDRISLPKNFMPEPPFDTLTLDIRDEKLMPRPLNPFDLKTEIGRYYGMITHEDQEIGRVLRRLEAMGEMDTTYIIFAGDNGLTLGAHGLLGKQTMYEEGIRVPLIIRGPGIPHGGLCNAFVDLMDIMPTMCEIAGIEIPGAVQGMSLLPLTAGNYSRARTEIFCHYDDLFRMVKSGEMKYILHLKTEREELFNLRNDPYEMVNLAHDGEEKESLDRMRRLLERKRREAGELF